MYEIDFDIFYKYKEMEYWWFDASSQLFMLVIDSYYNRKVLDYCFTQASFWVHYFQLRTKRNGRYMCVLYHNINFLNSFFLLNQHRLLQTPQINTSIMRFLKGKKMTRFSQGKTGYKTKTLDVVLFLKSGPNFLKLLKQKNLLS